MIGKCEHGAGYFNRWHIVLLIYVCVIYGNSLTPGDISSMGSGFVLSRIHEFMEMSALDSGWLTEHMVRKTAHFAEYAGFGMLLVLSFKTWIAPAASGLRTACELCVLVPFVDETIQLFVQGRSGQVDDIWLDLSGAFCGLVIMTVLMKLFGNKQSKTSGKDSQVKK